MGLILKKEYTCLHTDIVGLIQEVNGISWNEACEEASNAGLCGQDGSGYDMVYMGDFYNYGYNDKVIKALETVQKENPDVQSFKIIDD